MAEIARFTAEAPRRGSIDVPTDNGTAAMLASVAQVSGQLASKLGRWADETAIREGKDAGAAAAASVSMPGVEFAFDGSSAATTPGKPFKTSDPAATDLPAEARALLNAIAGGESGGSYNVRYTPQGPAHFADMSRHPGIFVPGPHGKTSASGRYQFTKTTWDGIGGGDFSPVNQDRNAWKLAQRDYGARTGRNLSADLKAGGLTPGIIKALSSTWAAFNSNQGRHVATYRESLSRYGSGPVTADPVTTASTATPEAAPAGVDAAPATTQPSPPADGIKVTLTGAAGAVPQMRAGTLRGDAYNNAALDIHVNRLDTAMREQMSAIALEHDGDPAGLSSSLDALRAGYVKDLPPAAAALIDQSFATQKFSLQRQAIDKFNSNLESANIAAFEENLTARTASAYRLAANGGTDAEADGAIAAELGALTAQIDASPMNPLQKSRAKADAVAGVMSARVLGGFEAQKDPAARAAYAQKFQEEWKSGEGLAAKLDTKTYDSINGELLRRTQADAVAANKRDNALNATIKSQIETLKKGWPVPDANREFIKNEIAKTGDAQLAANLDFLDGLAAWQKAHVASRPEIIDAQITALQAKIQEEGASEAALTTLDVMEGLRDKMKKGLADDPLAWANRVGVAKVEPLDFSDGANLTASLTERVTDATAIAQHYGIEPKFFTAAETDGLKKMLKQTPLALPSIVSSLSAGLGSATPQALAEISKDAPLLAHVAGLTDATGSQRVAVEVAEVLDRRNQPGYKSILPTAAKMQTAAASIVGPALIALPSTMNGAMETASTLFEARALARGVDMDQFDTEGSPARELYLDALDEVLGATTRNGVKYGGLANVNGMQTVAPPDIEADSLEGMVANISADDLLFQANIGSANGVPIRPIDLRQGKLVMTAQGRYRIALGDVAGGDPRYVPDAAGGYFELDIGMLKRTQQTRTGDSAGFARKRAIQDWADGTR